MATAAERFWAMILIPDDPEGCWVWPGAKIGHGYGQMYLRKGKCVLTHRFAYELLREPIPEGLVIDHLCLNKTCANPWHLEVVTGAENTRRGNGGKWNRDKTHCKHGHEFTPENTHVYPKTGKRRCKECGRIWTREYMKDYRIRVRAQRATRIAESLRSESP